MYINQFKSLFCVGVGAIAALNAIVSLVGLGCQFTEIILKGPINWTTFTYLFWAINRVCIFK